MPDDLALLHAAREGDHQALERLIVSHQDRLRIFVSVRTPSVELAEEIVQETFVIACTTLDSYDGSGPFPGWLIGIARNLLRREAERMRRHRPLLEADDAPVEIPDDAMVAAVQQRADQLRRCLDHLAPSARRLAHLRFVDGIPLNQLAQRFKRTRAAIACQLTRIRDSLRQCCDHALRTEHRP
jgi:RNA polymerase sigma factor (sigma-70 family)